MPEVEYILYYVNNSVCVCVCVCERERERELTILPLCGVPVFLYRCICIKTRIV